MGKIFKKQFWLEWDQEIWKAGIGYFIVTLLWIGVSIGLSIFEGERSYFEITAILHFKIVFVAVIFLGRYLLFPNHRSTKSLPWIFLTVFLIKTGTEVGVLAAHFNWGYFLLRIMDTIVWVLMATVLFEVLGVFYRHWLVLPAIQPANIIKMWHSFWNELLKMGIILTFLAGLTYYYLTSFYLIDTLIYSYILTIPLLLTGCWLFANIYGRLKRYLQHQVNLVDQEISNHLFGNTNEEIDVLKPKLIHLEYLMLIRNYWLELGRPVIFHKTIISYAFFCGFIIYLPYLFGLIVAVEAFKK